jgi:type VI secretion system protein ImpB
MSSVQEKLNRVRKPRIHIKYEVETEGAMVEKELPFVVGVMGDYSGDSPGEELKPLKERKFVNIDRDNFNNIMTKIKPGVSMRVENTIENDSSEMAVNLQFNSIDDFDPDKIVEKVDSLKKLKDIRDQLTELLTKTDRSDKLEAILEKTLQDPNALKSLAEQLGVEQLGVTNEQE